MLNIILSVAGDQAARMFNPGADKTWRPVLLSTIAEAPFPNMTSEVKSLSVELAATVMIHGARFVAEAGVASFPADATTSTPRLAA
ncbi:CO(2)-response secreted protease [Senna tora]|uniref:CO(2)-response secreted protease n=1 Tax=Senna tora TaxID=362788 RepID=A0A834SUP8_9FABA|nr:CO(2)-response secreted protease [Senna tora]